MRLSLHKGGNRPDYKGDLGKHMCSYGFLPHLGGFSAETVVRSAYAFNYRPLISPGAFEQPSLVHVDAPTVIVETVKPCEDTQKAYILRLYECEGSHTTTIISIPGAREITETNLLEEAADNGSGGISVRSEEITLTFRPFEIKTLQVSYN
jgi:alpha-mannosidase